jgi:hypothetical protein
VVVEAARCSLLAREDEPLPGTAPHAPAWLFVEDPGPWGRDALADGALPPAVVSRLAADLARHGVRHQAIRKVHDRPGDRRTVFLANVVAGWLARLDLDVADLGDLDVAAATRDEPPPGAEPVDDPLVVVCTHGKRDACCALWGRPMAVALAAHLGELVWETSHTGGHRFAPNILTFPAGSVHGFVDDAGALADAVAGGRLDLDHYRGYSGWPKPAQTAEVALRRRLGHDRPPGLDLVGLAEDDGHATATFTVDGGRHVVRLRHDSLSPRPVSCGAAPTDPGTWTVTAVDG